MFQADITIASATDHDGGIAFEPPLMFGLRTVFKHKHSTQARG